MSNKSRVYISEFKVAQAPAVLETYGLGSCLGIALYDPQLQLGGLAHTLLPFFQADMKEARKTKFVDTAVRLMVEELLVRGASRQRLLAKIAGGANMFGLLHNPSQEGIGFRNAGAARETLASLGIPVIAEDVGGNHGRSIFFDLLTGEVKVRSVQKKNSIIYI